MNRSLTMLVVFFLGSSCLITKDEKENTCSGADLEELMNECIQQGGIFRGKVTGSLQMDDCYEVNFIGGDDCQIVHSNGCSVICHVSEDSGI